MLCEFSLAHSACARAFALEDVSSIARALAIARTSKFAIEDDDARALARERERAFARWRDARDLDAMCDVADVALNALDDDFRRFASSSLDAYVVALDARAREASRARAGASAAYVERETRERDALRVVMMYAHDARNVKVKREALECALAIVRFIDSEREVMVEACARQVARVARDGATEEAVVVAGAMMMRGHTKAIALAIASDVRSCVERCGEDVMRQFVECDVVPANVEWASAFVDGCDARIAIRLVADIIAGEREDGARTRWRETEVIARALLNARFWRCDATRHALGEKMLLSDGVPRRALPAVLRLTILKPIARGSGDDERVRSFRDANVRAMLELWASGDFVRGGSVKLQRHLTASVRATLAALPVDEWNAIRGNPTEMILRGISARLDSPSPRARRHASKIALELSLKMDPSKPLRLIDAGDAEAASSDEEVDWERDARSIAHDGGFVIEGGDEDDEKNRVSMSVQQSDVNVGVAGAGFSLTIEDVDPDEIVDVWGVRNRRRIESDSDESDTEDDSDEELVPYEMDSDDDESLRTREPRSVTEARIASLPKPQTLSQCISALRQARSGDASTRKTDIDLADAAEGAVHYVSELVSHQPHELAAVASDLAVAVLHAQPPTPDSDPLDRARRQGLATLLFTAPGLVGAPLIEHALSDKCDASHVLDTLSAVEVAVARLASPPNDVKALHGANGTISEVTRRPSGTERRFAPKSIERQSQASTSAPTKCHLVGSSIAAPLLRAAHRRLERQSASGYDPDGLDATVMGQILYTLGQCARAAKNAIDGPLVGEAVLDFALLPALASSREPHLRRSALLACAFVATSLADVPVAVAYAENSPLARALERVFAIAAITVRADVDPDARAAAAAAVAAVVDVKSRASDALDRVASAPSIARGDALVFPRSDARVEFLSHSKVDVAIR